MNIVFEGPDLAGKTTASKLLRDKYGFKIYQATKPENVTVWMQQSDNFIMSLKHEDNIVWDRSPTISNYIYSTIFRHKYGLPRKRVAEYYDRIAPYHTLIYLDPSIWEISLRFMFRGDEHLPLIAIKEASRRYRHFFGYLMGRSPAHNIIRVQDSDTLDWVLNSIIAISKAQTESEQYR